MISTKFASAAALFALLSSALALPQSIERRKNDLPLWCDPGSPYDSNNAWYDDESGICQEAGIATNCCATFVSAGGICDADFGAQSVSDLENAIGQQIQKDGQFDITKVGKWTAGFGNFADDKVNPDVLTEWFHSISLFVGDAAAQKSLGGVNNVFFFYDANGVYTTVDVSYDC